MRITRLLRSTHQSTQTPVADIHLGAVLQRFPEESDYTTTLVLQLPYFTFEFRKILLKITRIRADIKERPLADLLVDGHAKCPTIDRYPGRVMTRNDAYSAVYDMVDNEVTNSLLSQYIRTVPPQPNHIISEAETEEFRKSFFKELEATQGEDRPNEVNWDVYLWEDEAFNRPHPVIPARSNMQIRSTYQYASLYEELQVRLFYPRYSRRHVSKESAQAIGVHNATGVDLERFYSRHGYLPKGRMEVRAVWNFNDLTPRTYFAMGSTVYQSSKYMQEIFMLLVDSFEITHRRRRFNVHRLSLDDSEDVWLYDYSSFTSNMTEQKYFVASLAGFFKGCAIKVVDTHHGVITKDLGQMLTEYNEVCCIEPEFYIGPTLQKRLGVAAGDYYHRKAGALGIYGNIASCTLAHGHISSSIGGGVDKTIVVGDDGTVIVPKPSDIARERGILDDPLMTHDMTRQALRVLGDIADSKFAILTGNFGSRFWTFLKRCFERTEDNEIHLGDQLHLFNMSLLTVSKTSSRGKRHTSSADFESEAYSLIMSIWALLIKIHRLYSCYSQSELEDVCIVLEAVYDMFLLKKEGSMRAQLSITSSQGSERRYTRLPIPIPTPSIPSPASYWYLERNPLENLASLYAGGIAKRRVLVYARVSNLAETYIPKLHSSFESTSTKRFNLLLDLGYLIREDVVQERELSMSEWVGYMQDFVYNKSMRPVYRYTVVRDIPSHLMYFT